MVDTCKLLELILVILVLFQFVQVVASGARRGVKEGVAVMTFYAQAQTLIKQFLHNLDEADWASRHVADQELGTSATRQFASRQSTSSLSLALSQMGIVRQSTDGPLMDYEA